MIRAVKLNKTYSQGKIKIEAVRSASLEILRGSSALITGPSGAGKSTLLQLLGGLDRPTSGNVFYDDIDFNKLSDGKRSYIRNTKIGFVFQFYHLLPEFNVLENVMLPALMRKDRMRERSKAVRERAHDLLDEVGLAKRVKHRPSELSGGESQRVAIVRSLINSPELLLCDEPTGNLDSKIGHEIIDCLWRLREKEEMSIVIVTHDENIHDDFDKTFRIVDGMLERIIDDTKDQRPKTKDDRSFIKKVLNL
ncbi:MAG: ABC transporter ATP-binding protein [Candidatus Omnitrophota bacterium]